MTASPLTVADLGDALALSRSAGWNQTLEDWQFFVAAGHAFAARDPAGRTIGTAAVLPYGATAWISMVLVDAAFRHRGIARALVEACLERIASFGALALLDATAAGEPVYARVGFRPGFHFERWQGAFAEGAGGRGESRAVDAAADADAVGEIARRDAAASGLRRRSLIASLLGRPETRLLTAPDDAFAIVRAGERAWQLGPLAAASESDAERLLEHALDGAGVAAAPVFLDVPSRWHGLGRRLEERGFVRQRGFVRMALGAPPREPGERQFVLAGPEFG